MSLQSNDWWELVPWGVQCKGDRNVSRHTNDKVKLVKLSLAGLNERENFSLKKDSEKSIHLWMASLKVVWKDHPWHPLGSLLPSHLAQRQLYRHDKKLVIRVLTLQRKVILQPKKLHDSWILILVTDTNEKTSSQTEVLTSAMTQIQSVPDEGMDTSTVGKLPSPSKSPPKTTEKSC